MNGPFYKPEIVASDKILFPKRSAGAAGAAAADPQARGRDRTAVDDVKDDSLQDKARHRRHKSMPHVHRLRKVVQSNALLDPNVRSNSRNNAVAAVDTSSDAVTSQPELSTFLVRLQKFPDDAWFCLCSSHT